MVLDNFRKIDMQINKANYYIDTQMAKEGDYNGRELVVQITDAGEIKDQTGVSLNLGWRHDSVGNAGLDPFTVVDISKGIFKIAYPAEMLNAGLVTAVIQVVESGKITLTRNFKITVENNPIDEDAIVSENSFTVLQEALVKVNDLEANYAPRLNEVTEQLAQKAKKHNYDATEYGVKGDGVVNDAPALNTLINLVYEDGGGTIFLPKGVYKVTSKIVWKSTVSLMGDGIGKTIIKSVGTGFPAIGYNDNEVSSINPMLNCTFQNFEIDGIGVVDSTYSIASKGIFIQYLRKCIFKDLYIHDTGATGLGVDFLDECIIDNVQVYNCGRKWTNEAGGAGIGIGMGGLQKEKLIITNCQVDLAGNYGIFIESQPPGGVPDYKMDGIIISDCIVTNGRNDGINLRAGGIIDENSPISENIVINNCIVENNTKNGISLMYFLNNVNIQNCITSGNGADGIFFEGNGNVNGISIKNNTIHANIRDGIRVALTSPRTLQNLDIEGNQINKNNSGVYFASTGFVHSTKINNNKIYDNTQYGLLLSTVNINDMDIKNNQIYENKLGIVTTNLADSRRLFIDSNSIYKNLQFGISIGYVGVGLSLINNKVYNNGQAKNINYQDGINIQASGSFVQIVNNWCYDDQTTKTQSRGIVQGGQTVFDYARIEMNDCRGNGSTGYIFQTNTNNVVQNNLL